VGGDCAGLDLGGFFAPEVPPPPPPSPPPPNSGTGKYFIQIIR